MKVAVLVVLILAIVSVDAINTGKRLKGKLMRQSAAKVDADASVGVTALMRRSGITSMAQFHQEFSAIVALDDSMQAQARAKLGEAAATEEAVRAYTVTLSNELLKTKAKDTGIIKRSMANFATQCAITNVATTTAWYVHSGTGSYLYGIRTNPLTDVDIHLNPISVGAGKTNLCCLDDRCAAPCPVGANLAHAVSPDGATGVIIEVDAWNPIVDRQYDWAIAMENWAMPIPPTTNIISLLTDANFPIGNPLRVITVAQLRFEYSKLLLDAARQAKPHKAKSDAETMANSAAITPVISELAL